MGLLILNLKPGRQVHKYHDVPDNPDYPGPGLKVSSHWKVNVRSYSVGFYFQRSVVGLSRWDQLQKWNLLFRYDL